MACSFCYILTDVFDFYPPRPSENVTLRLIIVDRATIATSPEPI